MSPASRHVQLDAAAGSAAATEPASWKRYRTPNRVVVFYRRFPVTVAVIAPYLLLILPPAVVFGNVNGWFLLGVAAIALTGTAIAETLQRPQVFSRPPRHNVDEYGRGLVWLSTTAVLISVVIGVLAAYQGKGSVAAQTGVVASVDGLVSALDSFSNGWVVVGLGMLFAAYIGGQCTMPSLFLVLSISVVGAAVEAYYTQITAPLFTLGTFVAMMAALLGIVKTRVLAIAALLVLLVWPVIFEFRNQLRAAEGVYVSASVEALDRLRFDLQYARAVELSVPLDFDVPGFLQNPSLLEILRFGIIPRVMDPERDLVSTGQVINVALGGSINSAYTFGPVTTTYVLEGAFYLLIYYFLLAILFHLVWRGGTRISPARMSLVALAVSGPLGWFSTFPDTLIGTLQNLVSAAPLLLVLAILRAWRRYSTKREASRSSAVISAQSPIDAQ